MTREESIYELKNAAWLGTDHSRARTEEALEMAIKALSQEPKYRMAYDYSDGTVHKFAWIDGGWKEIAVEPYCDDAISREAVDKYIARLLSGYLYDGERERLEIFSAYLWELPSVTHKSGKWIKKGNTLKCPFCGAKGEDIKDDYCFNYCPNCGAKMESEVNNG